MANRTPRPADPHPDHHRTGSVIPTGAMDRIFLELSQRSPQPSYMHVGAVMLVQAAAPDLAELRRWIGERLHRAPVLGYRLSGDHQRWERDPGFAPEAHIDSRRLKPGDDVLAAALAVAEEPLPPERPLWRLVMLHGYSPAPGGEPAPRPSGAGAAGTSGDGEQGGGEQDGGAEYALCYLTHHAFQDGMAIVATLEALFGAQSLPAPTPREGRAALRPWRWPAPTDLALRWRRTAAWTPAARPLTGRRRLLSFRLDQATLQGAARSADLTRNHLCLAALTQALRQWSPQDWAEPLGRRARRGLHVAMPLDLRAPGGGALGNQIGVLGMALPCHRAAPSEQLEQVVAQTGARRLLRHRDMHRALLPRLPYRLARAMYLRYADPRYVAMPVSTVRIRGTLDIAGHPVGTVLALPPLVPGQPMMIVLLVYHDQVSPSLIVDTAIPDAEVLIDLWQTALSRPNPAMGT
ncbi:wax ester/triacylglycerol synthase domain-containing protein [Spirillospora sp. CA-253888]